MSVTVPIELSDDDLKYFKDTLDVAKNSDVKASQDDIVKKAESMLGTIEKNTKLPDFIKEQFKQLHILINMLTDEDWDIPAPEKTKVKNVISYFTNSFDLIPDDVPGIGYLDEAILIDLVVKDIFKEFKNFLEYENYSKLEKKVHHKHHISRSEWEDHNRVSMYQRMRNRQAISASGKSGNGLDVF